MGRDAALESLGSTSAHDRLKSARELRKSARPEDRATLLAALRNETVSWVRSAIQKAIDRLDESPDPDDEGSRPSVSDAPEGTLRQLKARVTEEVTSTILHEFQPIIGLLRAAARSEIATYDTSRTKAQLDRFDALVDSIEVLKRAATTPRVTEFDFASLVAECISDEVQERAIAPSLVGPSPLVVRADRSLLRLAMLNGIRNAIDAVLSTKSATTDGDIVITWGVTDIDVWMTVIDRGPGLAAGAGDAFRVGTTTKVNHSGFGLAIAKQAMDSMEGEISLTPGETPGARFEIRWYR
jgi:signal transduction histidine kinase